MSGSKIPADPRDTRPMIGVHNLEQLETLAGWEPRARLTMPPGEQRRPIREALEPISNPYMTTLNDTLHIAKEVVMGSLQSDYRRSESVRILSDREPPLSAHENCS